MIKIVKCFFLKKAHFDMLDIGPDLYELCMCVSLVIDVTSTVIVM